MQSDEVSLKYFVNSEFPFINLLSKRIVTNCIKLYYCDIYQEITMIIYTNEGNPQALKLLICAKTAKKEVTLKIVSLNGELLS